MELLEICLAISLPVFVLWLGVTFAVVTRVLDRRQQRHQANEDADAKVDLNGK